MYEEFEKPANLIEHEGECPLCGTLMRRPEFITYRGKFYTFTFPLYVCIQHFHGYFRWLGRKGHVKVRFPGILRFGKVVGPTGESEPTTEESSIHLTCPDCGFSWEEVRIPHDRTWCPDCRREITISRDTFTH